MNFLLQNSLKGGFTFFVFMMAYSYALGQAVYDHPGRDLDTNFNNAVEIFGEAGINSTALTQDFIHPFIVGGHIDRELKDQVQDRLSKNNLIGGDIRTGILGEARVDTLFGKEVKGKFWAEFTDVQHFDASFTDDLFETIFYGNAYHAGKESKIAPFRIHSIHYQRAMLGWEKRRNKLSWKIGLGFVKGQKDLSIRFPEGTLVTEQKGRSLDFNATGTWERAGDSLTGYPDMNGMGGALDVQLRYGRPDEGALTFSIRDLGGIWWDKDVYTVRSDTAIRFEGFKGGDISQWDESFQKEHLEDTLAGWAQEGESVSYFTPLPSLVSIRLDKTLKDSTFHLGLDARLRPMAGYSPFVGINARKDLGPAGVVLSTGYGGYGTWQLGAAFFGKIQDRLYLLLRADHLEGILFSSRFGGASGSAVIRYEF